VAGVLLVWLGALAAIAPNSITATTNFSLFTLSPR
jgi:hypothetical protein